jgi:Fe-Mn family superoxide dismutase
MAFELPKLPYDYNALEPYLDAKTMEIHHDKHHAGYTSKLNAALEKSPKLFEKDIVEILSDLDQVSSDIRTAVRNNGGGYYHHNIWWEQFAPGKGGEPTGELAQAINKAFGSFAEFKEQFKSAALGVFGSGWAWLVKDKNGKLSILGTPNQDSPATMGLKPLLGLDVWEHSYYLKYQNRRNEYTDNFWHVIDWEVVSQRYA